jgi:uncharacterized Zn finger protein (UPF0148 family)
MNRLYQWLSERARFFRSDTSDQGMRRTVRTEVTVEREGMTLMMGGTAAGFDICPLCGNKLTPSQTEQATAPRQKENQVKDTNDNLASLDAANAGSNKSQATTLASVRPASDGISINGSPRLANRGAQQQLLNGAHTKEKL